MPTKDLKRIALILAAAVLLGWLTGHPLIWLAVAVLGYVAWLHYRLFGLLKWIRESKQHDPPESPGIFEDLALEIDHLRDRHKKRKKKLGNYLKQFRQATRALPDATVVLDEHGAVKWANRAAWQFFGVKWPDDADQRLTNLLRTPELRDFVENRKQDKSMEIPCPVDPMRQLSVRIAPYGRNQCLFVARDVTELHRAHQIRRDFVANVSHELRTPITVIRGYLENLQQQSHACPAAWEAPLREMSTQTKRMQSLVEELLLLSRLEQDDRVSDPRPVAVAELLVDIHQQAGNLSGFRGHVFALEADPELVINGDAKELYKAFANLAFNAVNYTPEQGIVKISWYRDAAGAHLEVTDNGIGMDKKHLPRITERFYRIDPSRSRNYGGTGLGLAIVKHVLARHGASLYIDSTLGKGSTFRCDFPAQAIIEGTPDLINELA